MRFSFRLAALPPYPAGAIGLPAASAPLVALTPVAAGAAVPAAPLPPPPAPVPDPTPTAGGLVGLFPVRTIVLAPLGPSAGLPAAETAVDTDVAPGPKRSTTPSRAALMIFSPKEKVEEAARAGEEREWDTEVEEELSLIHI